MKACWHYSNGDLRAALCVGGQYEDIEMGFMICDTGLTMEQIEALPRRMQRTLRVITRTKRLNESRRMF